ncbi:MAG: UPF0175 family protein [Promethearchaeota archaeon]
MKKQLNLRLDENIIKDLEELALEENLERSTLAKKILIEGLKEERFNFAIQKYVLKEISIERAAEMAKMSLHEFIFRLSQLGIKTNLKLDDYKKLLL